MTDQSRHSILCPYCGSVVEQAKRCPACSGFFDPLSRQATQNAMGPWQVRHVGQPFLPGCSYETLKELIARGKVTAKTVIRGPTTRQFWMFADRTPSVANLLGLCHNCHSAVEPDAYSCRGCGTVFTPEHDRQHVGLAPIHLLPGEASPEMIAAAAQLSRHDEEPSPPPIPPAVANASAAAPIDAAASSPLTAGARATGASTSGADFDGGALRSRPTSMRRSASAGLAVSAPPPGVDRGRRRYSGRPIAMLLVLIFVAGLFATLYAVRAIMNRGRPIQPTGAATRAPTGAGAATSPPGVMGGVAAATGVTATPPASEAFVPPAPASDLDLSHRSPRQTSTAPPASDRTPDSPEAEPVPPPADEPRSSGPLGPAAAVVRDAALAALKRPDAGGPVGVTEAMTALDRLARQRPELSAAIDPWRRALRRRLEAQDLRALP